MVDLSVAAIADTFDRKNAVGAWWFVPLHRALAQFGLYTPSNPEEARPTDSRDAGKTDGDGTIHWL